MPGTSLRCFEVFGGNPAPVLMVLPELCVLLSPSNGELHPFNQPGVRPTMSIRAVAVTPWSGA